jgi:hypothetical protein
MERLSSFVYVTTTVVEAVKRVKDAEEVRMMVMDSGQALSGMWLGGWVFNTLD